MDAANALFDGHRIPRQVVIEQHTGALEVDSFTTSRRGYKKLRAVVIPKPLGSLNLVFQRPALDGGDFIRTVNLR